MNTKLSILETLKINGEATVAELADNLSVSRQMIHRALNILLEEGTVIKLGKPPKTFYKVKKQAEQDPVDIQIDNKAETFLKEHFFLVTETGMPLEGIEAMKRWCRRQNLPIEKTIKEFIITREKYLDYFLPSGLIDGMDKLRSSKAFRLVGLDAIYYLDFYAIERFGKTKLGALMHFAKQGQNKQLMDQIIFLIKDRVLSLVKNLSIDAVGYIPPTIKRDIQFMKVLEQKLNIPLPHIGIEKVKGDIIIPQKALSKIEDRIHNAQSSLMVTEKRNFKKILLIDDAMGSGASLNETAVKLKNKKTAKWVGGLAVTGSFKGFEVIQEV